ncbi:MAG: GyrI-like domain-containing protein [Myxococcota bacterium]
MSNHRREYTERINRVLDYIDTHLAEELSLAKLAEIAHFSPYHFHRIFRAMMDEPLSQYVQRVRLSHAAAQLALNVDRSVTEIALDHGFSSTASFGRAFRQAFGQSPTEFRRCRQARTEEADGQAGAREMGSTEFEVHSPDGPRTADRKIGSTDSKVGTPLRKLGSAATSFASYQEGRRRWTMSHSDFEMNVRVEELPEERIAYIRHIGPYAGDSELFGRLFGQLAGWAGPRGLLGPHSKFVAVYHDNPEVTDPEKLRLSVGVNISAETEVGGEVGALTLPSGRYALAHLELTDASQYARAWKSFIGDWLPDSGYEPADGWPFERYLNNPETDPNGKHIVELILPVKPL